MVIDWIVKHGVRVCVRVENGVVHGILVDLTIKDGETGWFEHCHLRWSMGIVQSFYRDLEVPNLFMHVHAICINIWETGGMNIW